MIKIKYSHYNLELKLFKGELMAQKLDDQLYLSNAFLGSF